MTERIARTQAELDQAIADQVEWIEIRYPEASLPLLGIQWNWLVWFFVVSVAAVFMLGIFSSRVTVPSVSQPATNADTRLEVPQLDVRTASLVRAMRSSGVTMKPNRRPVARFFEKLATCSVSSGASA